MPRWRTWQSEIQQRLGVGWHNRWEFADLEGFGLQLGGLVALLASVLSGTA